MVDLDRHGSQRTADANLRRQIQHRQLQQGQACTVDLVDELLDVEPLAGDVGFGLHSLGFSHSPGTDHRPVDLGQLLGSYQDFASNTRLFLGAQ